MQFHATSDGFVLALAGRELVRHSAALPWLFVGQGRERIEMHRGNFEIEDRLVERVPLPHVEASPEGGGWRLAFRRHAGDAVQVALHCSGAADRALVRFTEAEPRINRVWLRLVATAEEHVWGCGEQLSHLDLRGRHFPLWTSEPGVGRDKTTLITWQADVAGKAGGDYWHTNYPEPTFLSSRRYMAHVETTAYADFDFRDPAFHELQVWAVPDALELIVADDLLGLVEKVSARFGRQPPLPEWVHGGAILGLKRGGADAFARLERALAAGVEVAGLWCEDWAGIRVTSFGSRLFWDWTWNAERHPGLDRRIQELRARGIRFLAYVNPHLCVDGTLYPEAAAAGHLTRTAGGEIQHVDFGEFDCGTIDLTNPAARAWFKDRILRRNMIDLGISGWMADFGEYLPVDAKLHDGSDARLMHNAWPTLWARLNAEAVAEAGRTGEVLFFMRAGYTGVQRWCPLLWAGDQSVDFSRHDGLVSVVCAALSAGLVGNAYHHSDIGGYTSLFGNRRTPELLMRWAEMAAFTAVMRTHESNRPEENCQFDDDPAVLVHFARTTRIYRHLTPYLRELVGEARARGLPVQRPLFLHFEADPLTHTIQDQYLYGPDLLVAPVHRAGAEVWEAYLPAGADWVHVWSGEGHPGGRKVTVAAPLGAPPVFWREGSRHAALFRGLGAL
ncbi:MAG TPA: alpha-glucosidase [Geminicoccaceae bacterium]|nr:alpha-glucosidase [Geminicoccaceae bacterium]